MSSEAKRTRFPPEPNGYLHLGHVKAMRFDFELDNNCILRMDDTNSEVEKQEYVDSIVEDVKWLGYKFSKLTYTSDYFDQLYEFAIVLIRNNLAYVDFTPSDKIKLMRRDGIESVYRSRSIEWNLEQFEKMKMGDYKENEAVLRLKIDMASTNHTLRDPIAYRIKYTPHYRTGTKYCIYPSYDYSHGIVDTLEGITDSFCTTEFLVRRDQYYWPVLKLQELGLLNGNIPKVVEFGRLNIEGVELSKRKIIPLIENKKVTGFDDPRLYTIRGLRRRGYTPDIIKNIVSHVSMDRKIPLISKSLVDFELRNYLDKTAHRAFAVINPLLVTNDDLLADTVIECNHPNHPVDKSLGSHETLLTNEIYIERTDFREIDSPDYYRLAPNKIVRLKYGQFIRCESYDLNKIIKVSNIVPLKPKKIKGVLHWVCAQSPRAIFEIYDELYVSGTINENSQVHVHEGYIEKYVLDVIQNNCAEDNKIFQFERLGYFKFDRFNVDGIPVFIRVIDLVNKYDG